MTASSFSDRKPMLVYSFNVKYKIILNKKYIIKLVCFFLFNNYLYVFIIFFIFISTSPDPKKKTKLPKKLFL